MEFPRPFTQPQLGFVFDATLQILACHGNRYANIFIVKYTVLVLWSSLPENLRPRLLQPAGSKQVQDPVAKPARSEYPWLQWSSIGKVTTPGSAHAWTGCIDPRCTVGVRLGGGWGCCWNDQLPSAGKVTPMGASVQLGWGWWQGGSMRQSQCESAAEAGSELLPEMKVPLNSLFSLH